MLKPDQWDVIVIGAGASGLTVADALRRRGYSRVLVLEKSSRAGGKCLTETHDGRHYDLGAIFLSSSYTTTLRQMSAVGMEPGRYVGRVGFYDLSIPGRRRLLDTLDKPLLALEALRYRKALAGPLASLARPGLSGAPAGTHLPFDEWARRNRMPRIGRLIDAVGVGWGYGYSDRVAAAYRLKLMPLARLEAVRKRAGFIWPEGAQALWTRLAAGLDVRHGAVVQRVRRSDSGVVVTTADGELEAERLVITSPLDESLAFLDATPEEISLFRRIRWLDYRVALCSIDGLPAATGYLMDHFKSWFPGRPISWNRRYADRDLTTVYTLANDGIDDARVEANLVHDLGLLGGRVRAVRSVTRWRYFPHLDPEDLREGWHDSVEAMQGQRRTFYAGEAMTFACVDDVSAYAEALVERHFAVRAAPPSASSAA